jgi:hypothetical protein
MQAKNSLPRLNSNTPQTKLIEENDQDDLL